MSIVYDALVDPRILELAQPSAALEDAGKRGGRPSPTPARHLGPTDRAWRARASACCASRAAIPSSSAAAARRRWRWPRPASRSASCPASPPAIGGLAYAGIPVTHRDINSAVTFVTGHDSDGAVPARTRADWAAIARGSPVIVIYMALKHLGDIAERLIAAGRPPDEPVAIVSKATTPAQRVVVTTLDEAASVAATAESPAIIVIGEVARLHETLDWYGG